jgi:sugar phosphate isomerase/epimerase
MQLSLSTLGCPEWSLETICETAAESGYDGLDFRGYLDEIDVTRHPQFTDRLAETRSEIADAGLTVSGLSSGIHICDPDAREANVAEARRFVSLARDLDVDRIRVFGGGDDDRSTDELARIGGETMREILDLDGAADLRWLVETHDAWTSSADCETLLGELPRSNTGLVWDAAHTIRRADESPADTLDALGDRIEYVHLKDAVYDPDDPAATDRGWAYVLPGEGELPIDEVIRELDARGYDGWLVFEHEKRWHPAIPDPEVAAPAFPEWYDSVER